MWVWAGIGLTRPLEIVQWVLAGFGSLGKGYWALWVHVGCGRTWLA